MKNFGGHWTEEKLEVFEKYVIAYLTIMNKYKKKYSWKTIYFDGFAGYGEKKIINAKSSGLFDFPEVQELGFYKGSAARILNLPYPYRFDWYYFIDIDDDNLKKLESLKKTITHIPAEKIVIRKGDANEQVVKLAEVLQNSKYAGLVFLDPFGMQIDWQSIATFKSYGKWKKKVDLWILLPSGVAINRLLDKKLKFKDKYKDKLEKFFGLSINEIEEVFFETKKEITLFAEQERKEKIKNPIEQIAKLYIKQLKTIFKYVTEKPLVLRNSRNVPIFHFIFAGNNKSAEKIASQIIEKKHYGK